MKTGLRRSEYEISFQHDGEEGDQEDVPFTIRFNTRHEAGGLSVELKEKHKIIYVMYLNEEQRAELAKVLILANI